jgi:hypothetical protein
LYASLRSSAKTVAKEKKAPDKFLSEEETIALVNAYVKDRKQEVFEEILDRIDGMVHAIIYERGIHRFEDIDEIMQKLRIKIWRVLPQFDASRGKFFTFVTIVVHNTLGHINTELINRSSRFTSIESNGESSLLDVLPAPEDYCDVREEVNVNIMNVRTTCTIYKEIKAQRWLVLSFIESQFTIRRHEAANAMVKVFAISKDRSRELYDQTLLELRRQLLHHAKIPTMKLSQLLGTRQKPLAPYLKTQGQERFDKLVFLMRGVAPSVNFNPNVLIDGSNLSKPLF